MQVCTSCIAARWRRETTGGRPGDQRCRPEGRKGYGYERIRREIRMMSALMQCASRINCHRCGSRVPDCTAQRRRAIHLLRAVPGTGRRRACRTAVTVRCGQRASERRGHHPQETRPNDHPSCQSTKHREQLQFPVRRTAPGRTNWALARNKSMFRVTHSGAPLGQARPIPGPIRLARRLSESRAGAGFRAWNAGDATGRRCAVHIGRSTRCALHSHLRGHSG